MNDAQRIASYGGTVKFDGTVLGLTPAQSRRRNKKANHQLRLTGLGTPHPVHRQRPDPQHPDGSPLPVNCLVCRPGHAPRAVSV